MGASAVLDPAPATVDPGGQASVQLRVKNNGTVVDEFTFEVLGDIGSWAAAEPPSLSLFPGAEGTTTIVFRPPRASTVPAGPLPYGVMVRSREDAAGSVVEEGTLSVGAFHEPSAELVPRTSRGSRAGRHELAIDNRGNVPLAASVEGVDPDKLVRFEVDPPRVDVPPGTAGFAKIRVRPNRTFWRGTPKSHPFQLLVAGEDTPAVPLEGLYLQESILPSWFMRALIAALVLLVAGILLWLLVLQPSMKSSAEQALRDFGFSPKPGSSAAAGGGGGGGGASPTPSLAPGSSPGESPDATSVTVSPPPGVAQAPVSGRLDPTITLTPGGTLFITDLVFSNPTGASGDLKLWRQEGGAATEDLLVLRLENFRDLDFHFVTPITVTAAQTLGLEAACTAPPSGPVPDCNPSLFYSGYVQTAP